MERKIRGYSLYYVNDDGNVIARGDENVLRPIGKLYRLQNDDSIVVKISIEEINALIEVEEECVDIEKVVREAPPIKKEEGKFTTEQSVKTCRTKAALEEIVEANKFDVDLGAIKLLRDQKKAVLKVLRNKK